MKTKRYNVYTTLAFILLYAPLLVMILFSFNATESTGVFSHFSLKWYQSLFRDEDGSIRSALIYSLTLAISSSLIATLIGTAAALGLSKFKRKPVKRAIMTVTNIPMVNPDIVTAVSLVLLFSAMLTIFGLRINDFTSLLIAHITFNLPYVILNVMPKLKQMDASLSDAAMDLGCTPVQAFFRVTIHEIMPGVVSGAIMAFTMSLDDFVISYFVTGLDFVTLPVEIYSYTKKPIQPKIYAMFTLLFLLIFVLMTAMNLIQLAGDKKKIADRAK